MNILAAGVYLLHGPDLKDLAQLELHPAVFHEHIHVIVRKEFVPAMDARTGEHLERSAEPVLVDRGRAREPEIYVDVKARSGVDRDRRIAKVRIRIGLRRQFWRKH